MIKIIRNWSEEIIIAVIISIIIENLIPEGKNKKYVKVVIGIFILYTILNPIFSNLNYDFDLKNEFNYENSIETSSTFSNDIKDIYIKGIEEEVKKMVEKDGFIANSVKVSVDKNYEEIQEIQITLKNKEILIEPIIIGNNVQNQVSQNGQYENLIKDISENFSVDSKKIIIKE